MKQHEMNSQAHLLVHDFIISSNPMDFKFVHDLLLHLLNLCFIYLLYLSVCLHSIY